ncbi:MAG: 3-dehydroquinate synthase [Candidatus Aegiribacteria sp.]|nr:3-dehydroquinate synthase [Candidatus Aegiribacteria sp.]
MKHDMMDFIWHINDPMTVIHTYAGAGADGSNWIKELTDEWKNPFLVVDSEVGRLWNHQLQTLFAASSGLYLMEATEELKNTFTLDQIWGSMAGAGVRRDTPCIVIGGGLTCDMGAMAASTYLRGLKLMLVPTTLLSMVDACLGGKTGVNLAGVKNQAGTFYPAEMIVISPGYLDTLPEREFRNGMAEALKTALIGDPGIRIIIQEVSEAEYPSDRILEMIERCLIVKGDIVSEDLLENDSRMLLNLGHTVGHVLESASEFRLSHGEAVGLGMIAEAAIAVRFGGNSNLPDEIKHFLEFCGLPTEIQGIPSSEVLAGLLQHDKKTRRNGRIWALPFDWGDCRLTHMTNDQEEEILPEIMSCLKA